MQYGGALFKPESNRTFELFSRYRPIAAVSYADNDDRGTLYKLTIQSNLEPFDSVSADCDQRNACDALN